MLPLLVVVFFVLSQLFIWCRSSVRCSFYLNFFLSQLSWFIWFLSSVRCPSFVSHSCPTPVPRFSPRLISNHRQSRWFVFVNRSKRLLLNRPADHLKVVNYLKSVSCSRRASSCSCERIYARTTSSSAPAVDTK